MGFPTLCFLMIHSSWKKQKYNLLFLSKSSVTISWGRTLFIQRNSYSVQKGQHMQIQSKGLQSRSPDQICHTCVKQIIQWEQHINYSTECQKIPLHSCQSLKPKHAGVPNSHLKILKGKWTVNKYGESISNSSTWWDHLLINIHTIFCIQPWIKILELCLWL